MVADVLSAPLLALLKEVAAGEGFRNPQFRLGTGTKPGDNFVGIVHRVKIEEKQDGGRKSNMSLILKCQPENEARRIKFRTSSLFSNEAMIYNVVFPEFLSFQRSTGILTGLAPSHPRCLHADDLLILEDQGPLGFVMKDRMEPLDLAHCLLIMRELGRMHAVSFAMRDQRPSLFKRVTSLIDETCFRADTGSHTLSYFEVAGPRALDKFREYSQVERPERYIEPVEKCITDMFPILMETVKCKDAEPYAVINHGDCWTNNLLFKYNQSNTAPESACLLDFQLARYASPACDLSYFLFCCTNKVTRDEHYHTLLKEYHSSLAAHLAAMGSDVNKMFPWSALQNQMKKFAKYGLCMAMACIPSFTCNSEEMPNIDEASSNDGKEFAASFIVTHANDKECWERASGVIIDFVNLGYVA